MTALYLPGRQWLRRWRLPEMRLLFLALLVSVVAVSSVGFFTDRVSQAMQRQAIQLLGGDLVINSARPLPDSYRNAARRQGVQMAETISFRSMVAAGDKLVLAQVKAVSANYPLQGQLEGTTRLDGVGSSLQGQVLQSGTLWAEPRLFHELGVVPGSSVQLGRKTFVLEKVVTKDPARGSSFFQLAPSVLLPLDDLAATGLLSPASRAEFELLFSGDAAAIRRLQAELKPQLQATEQIRSLEDGVPTVRQALQRAGRFLGLAALLSVVLAGAAIVLTSASLVRHETRTVAVLKAFGLSRKAILTDYLLNLAGLALLAGVLGAIIGFVLQYFLAGWLVQYVEISLPPARIWPAFSGLLTALLMVLGFATPYLRSLVDTSPLQILQGSLHSRSPVVWLLAASILPAIFLLLWLQAGELRLTLWLFGGILLALLLFGGGARLALGGLARLSLRPGWEWLSLLRHSRRAGLLVMVFSMGLFTLLLLTSLRTDLLARWQETLPKDAPNYFLINIQPDEVQPLQAFLSQQGVSAELFPMIRGRLVEVNGKPLRADAFDNPRARRLLEREFNLSSFAEFPSTNTLIAGKWFGGSDKAGFSIEQGIGETLHFGLGDTLTFDIAGERYTEPVTSVREVRWDSMQPNFFVTAAPGALDNKPRTFITSLYIDPAKTGLVPAMIHQFQASRPSIPAPFWLRCAPDRAGHPGRTGIFAFTLVTGVLVLLAALQSQKPERSKEFAILKSMGAVHAVLRKRIWGEFLLLGALAGGMAGLFTLLSSNVLGYYLFELGLGINLWILLAGVLCGALLVSVAAWFNLRALLIIPPVALLKT
ncbi:MAG: FtsX-like permease family protein [Thiolinea sp.]